MSIKLRLPEAGEERLSWCKNIQIKYAGDEGLKSGSVDVQFRMPESADDFRDMLEADDFDITEALEEHVKDVKGVRDEDGNEYESDVQIGFVCRSSDVSPYVFEAFTDHALGGKLKSKTSNNSPGRRSRARRK